MRPESRIPRDRRRESGLALVLVLWTLALLALVVAGFLAIARSETRAIRARIDAARAEAVADGGVHWAAGRLALGGFGGEADPDALPVDGREITVELPGGTARIRIQDAGGLVDLNKADAVLISGLIGAIGGEVVDADRLAARILDYRDPDSRPEADGAEDRDYAARDLPFGAKDAPFERVDELRRIPGVGFDLARRLAPYFTVHNGSGGVDSRTAPGPVLAAVPELVAPARGGARAEFAFDGGSSHVAMSSRSVFRIRVVAQTPEGGRFVREAVISLTRAGRRPYSILEWSQGWAE